MNEKTVPGVIGNRLVKLQFNFKDSGQFFRVNKTSM